MGLGRIFQRLLAVLLAVSMTIAGTVGAYAGATLAPHLQGYGGVQIVGVRFISPDTMDPTMPGVGTNRYAYSQNDPVNKSDPNGHIWGILGGIIVGAIGALFGGTKDANTPKNDNDVSNTSDAESLANMAIGAASGTALGKIARGIVDGKKKEEQKQALQTETEAVTDSNPPSSKAAAGVDTDGQLFSRTIKHNGNTYKVTAERTVDGSTVNLKNLTIDKIAGTSTNTSEAGAFNAVRTEIAKELRAMGFERAHVTATRISGANAGRSVDFIVDLGEFK